MTPQTLDELKDVRHLVATAWTAGAYARLPNGAKTTPLSPEACTFCALGAMRKLQVSDSTKELIHAYAVNMFGKILYEINDQDGQEAVLQVFDRAIQDCAAALPAVDLQPAPSQGS